MNRILLADDSPHAQRMGERILREEGYEVVSVTDGETALLRLDDVDPDLIVADVFLPGRSGLDVCRHVKGSRKHRHTRVILTAGMLETFDEEAAKAAGADAIVKKPFEASVVLDTIKPLIAAAHAAREEGESSGGVAAAPPAEHAVAATTPEPGGTVDHDPIPVAAEIPVLRFPPSVALVTEEERVRAAVTIALDAAFPTLVDEITAKVLVARRDL